MPLALMFHVKDGGVSEPVKWNKDNLQDDRSIIILDEGSSSLYLWHGSKQSLVQRRTALRQAQSLKGHGYTIGKSIIGRDTKQIIEIDQRKIGREPETTKNHDQLQEILNKKFKQVDELVITFQLEDTSPTISKPKVKAQIQTMKAESTSKQTSTKLSKPVVQAKAKVSAPSSQSTPRMASEYQEPVKPASAQQERTLDQAKIGMLIASILQKYEDIWISKKSDGSYSVEMMDGPICSFSISGGTINFLRNSFNGISTNIKSEIQKNYEDMAKLL
ncbi:MAG: hypothetical protein JW891_10325 [Candidatus Lokiarchaeota archaeon]|nr:hypothetical protein [Candidatus Lokiarchaeota archaeon]